MESAKHVAHLLRHATGHLGERAEGILAVNDDQEIALLARQIERASLDLGYTRLGAGIDVLQFSHAP